MNTNEIKTLKQLLDILNVEKNPNDAYINEKLSSLNQERSNLITLLSKAAIHTRDPKQKGFTPSYMARMDRINKVLYTNEPIVIADNILEPLTQ